MFRLARLLASCTAFVAMSDVLPQCTSWCVNTGTAYISQTPSCFGESYAITIAGEYSWNSWSGGTSGTFSIGPGTYTIQFISNCYTQTPYQYCCQQCYDELGNLYCCLSCTACEQYNYTSEHSVTIIIPEYPCTMDGSAAGHAPSVFGCSDGSITYSGTTNACNGFLVYGPNGWQGQGNGTITGLAAGQYTLYFYSDPGGCYDEVLVTVPSGPCTLSAAISAEDASSTVCADGSISVTGNSGTCLPWSLWISRDGTEQFWGSFADGETVTIPSLLPGNYSVGLEHSDGEGTCQQQYPVSITSPGCLFPFTTATVEATAGGACADGRIVLTNNTGCDQLVSIHAADSTTLIGTYWHSWYANDTVPALFNAGTYLVRAFSQAYDPFTQQTITCDQWSSVVVGEPCQLDASAWTTAPSSLACSDGSIHLTSAMGGCFQQQAQLYRLGGPSPVQNAQAEQGDTIRFSELMPGTYVLHTQQFPWMPGGCEQRDTLTVANPGCLFPFTTATVEATAGGACADGRIVLTNNTGCDQLVSIHAADSTTLIGTYWHSWYANDTVPALFNAGTYLVRAFSQAYDPFTQQTITCDQWSSVVVNCAAQVSLSGRVLLEGPYDPGSGLMHDHLRIADLIPATEPYTALGHVDVATDGSVGPSVFATTGNNAIVDWVLLELRDPTDPALIRASRAALVQRDGDLVAEDGFSPVPLPLPAGSYLVAVHHRNHLGCMTAQAVAMDLQPVPVDFTSPALITHGTDARRAHGSTMLLWAGDVDHNKVVRYTGPANDRDPLLQTIGGAVPTATLTGQYRAEDVNLDGEVKYVGPANDRDPILQSIGGTTPTATRTAHVP